VVDAEAMLARNALDQWRDRLLTKVLNRPAGGADQVVMMARLAPDVRRHMPGPLQPLRQARADEPVEGAKYRGPPDIGMLLTDPVVQLLGRGLLAGLRQHRGDRQALGRQADTGLLKRCLSRCLNHSQMILSLVPESALRWPHGRVSVAGFPAGRMVAF
jgi:hypothetical protein